jgi:hypothetical protein
LNLSGCEELDDKIFDMIITLPLQNLIFGGTDSISPTGFIKIAHITTLQRLDLSDCNLVNDAVLTSFNALALRELNILGWNEVTPDGVINIKINTLQCLKISTDRFSLPNPISKTLRGNEISNFINQISCNQDDQGEFEPIAELKAVSPSSIVSNPNSDSNFNANKRPKTDDGRQ